MFCVSDVFICESTGIPGILRPKIDFIIFIIINIISPIYGSVFIVHAYYSVIKCNNRYY